MSAPQSLIEEVLPRFDASEVHDVWVLARPPAFRPARSAPVLDEFTVGVVPLGERPGAEIAAGAVGRFWRLAGNEPRIGSGAIRKSWLAAIRRRAVRAELGGPGA